MWNVHSGRVIDDRATMHRRIGGGAVVGIARAVLRAVQIGGGGVYRDRLVISVTTGHGEFHGH